MTPFDADGASVVEAMNHATYVLAVAADASRGGPVVDQIEYVPGDVAGFDKILLGSAACVGAYAWAAYEFGSVSERVREYRIRNLHYSRSRGGTLLLCTVWEPLQGHQKKQVFG